MTTGIGSYVVPEVTSGSTGLLEVTLTAEIQTGGVNVGTVLAPLMAKAYTFNGNIPGPTFKLQKDDTVIVRFINKLDHPSAIHWHGLELENCSDGTPFTQDSVAPSGGVGPPVPGRSTYLYKFKVPRPGIYWYHPHHHHSTNQVFKGLYGMIVVADPHDNDLGLRAPGAPLPPTPNTLQLVLSDLTVCNAPYPTYPPTLPWVGNPAAGATPYGGPPFPGQGGPTPTALCSTSPINDFGDPLGAPFGPGEIPNIQHMAGHPVGAPPGTQTNEGQLVLTNGMNAGGRAGWPASPGAPAADAQLYPVSPGQGLRLQIVNSSTVRYFRLILTKGTGAKVDLVRVGGEGGLLDQAVVEGNPITPPPAGTFDFQYRSGEILLPPGSRADVVAAIDNTASGVWTLWTQDFQRTGGGYSNIPTVPVMHLNVTGAAVVPAYTIGAGTPVLAAPAGGGESVTVLGAPIAPPEVLDPNTFAPPKVGNPSADIVITSGGGVATFDQSEGPMDEVVPYYNSPHVGDPIGAPTPKRSSRFAAVGLGNVLELTVLNSTGGHHPFHLHGFSMQPVNLTKPASPTYTWPYPEFRDNIDIPPGYKLRFRIRIDDRPLADGLTTGGALGRWMFHCHIFFHAHAGMMSELVACAPNGREKPNVNVVGSWAFAAIPGLAKRHGTFAADAASGVTVTSLLAHLAGSAAPFGILTPTPALPAGSGAWDWQLDTALLMPNPKQYVYVTATDSDGRKDQAVFRLQIGGIDGGSDTGDPHITTVDGKHYDFQQAGEFTLLRDPEAFEIQVRQTPVPTAPPVVDPNSGLTACVSVNTAVAVRVGAHRISYQPHPDVMSRLAFFLDGKQAQLPVKGLDLGGAHVVATTDADGSTTIKITEEGGAAITIQTQFWTSYNVAYMNVSVANSIADEGLMGRIPEGTWLPQLPYGATVGPKPESLHERYLMLYRTFANAWRVTDTTSLFTYAPGTSTATFTDVEWPAEKPPCKVKPGLEIPGSKPPLVNLDVKTAERIASPLKFPDLLRNCVFDMVTTGDETLVKGYLAVQDLRLNGTLVQIGADREWTRHGERVCFTAIVSAMTKGRPIPTGKVTFLVDGHAAGPAEGLDKRGRAHLETHHLRVGVHRVRALYAPSGKDGTYHAGTSRNLLHTVVKAGTEPKDDVTTGMQGMPTTNSGGTSESRPNYDAQAGSFDHRAGLPPDACAAVARAVCEIAGHGSVVEVGAGTGAIGLEIAKLCEGYVGMDLSPAMLDRFRQRLGDVRATLIVADADQRWPVEDGSCRAVFGSRSLHLLHHAHLLAELERVRSPKSFAVLAGRVERERDSVRARMRHEMKRLLREAGHDGRSGSDSTSRLILDCEARGAKALGPRVVASWTVRASPADSLRSWTGKDGLAGLSIDAGIKSEVLDRLGVWAKAEFGDLERPVESKEEYILKGAIFGGAPEAKE